MPLLLQYGESLVSGVRLYLDAGEYRFGRSPDCAIRLNCNAVSRHHALIAIDEHQATITDLGSRHGTTLNSEIVSKATTLQDGNIVGICDFRFLVTLLPQGIEPNPSWQVVGRQQVSIDPLPTSAVTADEPSLLACCSFQGGPGARLAIDCCNGIFVRQTDRLRHELKNRLQDLGWFTKAEDVGPGWSIEMHLRPSPVLDTWIDELIALLQAWSFAERASLTITRYQPSGGIHFQRIALGPSH